MRLAWAEQYKTRCVLVEPTDLPDGGADDTLEWARQQGATYEHGHDDEGQYLIVAAFPGRPPELYTSRAFLASLRSKGNAA